MKKSKKSLLISGLLMATIGIGAITLGVKENLLPIFKENEIKAKAYQYNPNNILDNVFTQEGMTILPFIYENSDQTVSKDYVKEQFHKAGIEIISISTETIGTGTQIKTKQKTYTILIYGDVDGDGFVDVFDAQKVMLHYVFAGENTLTGIYELAANVDNEDLEIDVFDAQRIIQFYVGYEENIIVKEPISDHEKDKEKPVITLLGENPQKIKLGDSYVELGAKATDNMDANVSVEIDASKVNTNRVGTYTVTYNAKDASGNKAIEVRRTVIVEDYIKNIEIIEPNKTTYQFGEEIDLTDGQVKVIYASDKTEKKDIEASMITGYNANTIGRQTITVTYQGKIATFEVEVLAPEDDYITDIQITGPTKTVYKVGQTLDLTGAKLKKVMHSGASVAEESITEEMIDKKELNSVGEFVITVSYQTNNTLDGNEIKFTKTFQVQVQNYVKEIELTPPTKTNYKYNEEIQTEGMIVNAIMGDGNKIDITSQVRLDTTKATMDTHQVMVSYETDNTRDDQRHVFEKTFTITVQNYIQEIEIASIPTKTNYIEGQNIEKEGMIVKVVKANGEKEEIDLTDSDLEITPNQAIYGNNTITVSYTTNNTIDDQMKTFEKTFEIMVLKQIQTILVTEDITTGYRYETISMAKIKSGENEEKITKQNLTWEIRDENNLLIQQEGIAKVTVEESQFDEKVKLNFTATIAGIYTITPKVGTISGTPIRVTIDENPIVTKMELGELGEKFRKGQTRIIDVDFIHEYVPGNETNIEVQARRLKITTTGLEVSLIDETGTVIHLEDRPNAIVKAISIKALTEGKQTMAIQIDEGSEEEYSQEKQITVLPEAKVEVKIGDLTEITLYLQKPENTDMVQEENGLIYSLLPIQLEDEDGIQTKIKLEDITNNGKVSILDSLNDPSDPYPSIQYQGYKKVGDTIQKVVSLTEEIDYVGIALNDEQAGEDLKNGTITISYQDSEVVLSIQIPKKTITQVIVTQDTTTGYRYETISIAQITSGKNEESITSENLNCEIKDENNQIITDKSIAKITAEESQFDEKVKLNFMASKAGTYEITPKVGGIAGDTITVTIDENPKVSKMILGDLGETFRMGQTRTMDINFIHEYSVGNESEISVEAKRIKIVAVGLECQLLDGSGTVIHPEERPNAIVKAISIKAVEAGNQVMLIKVDEESENQKTETKNITILPEAITEVKVDGLTNITLYLKNPGVEEMVKEDATGIYTLIPIWLENEDGIQTKITQEDIINGKVKILDSQDDPEDPFPSIQIQGYKKVGDTIRKVTGPTEEMDYVGIALNSEEAGEDLREGHIILIYGKSSTILDIIIPKKEIEHILVTQDTTTGYCYDTITIAKIKSGLNEEEITTENLTWEIRDNTNLQVTDESIAKVTVTKSQFDNGIEMNFTSTIAGTYLITPIVGEVRGEVIRVTIDENPVVSKINFGSIAENFRVGQTKKLTIDFVHEYAVGNEKNISVEAQRIHMTGLGLDYVLLDEENTIIDVIERPNAIVKAISIKALAEGTQTIYITIDKGSNHQIIQSKELTILPEAKPEVKVNGLTKITLYKNAPMDMDMVKEENGSVYTLIPIWLEDEEGNKTKIKAGDLSFIERESGKINIIDSENDPADPYPNIIVQGYKIVEGNIQVAGSAEEIDYVGIAFAYDGAESFLQDAQINISCDGMLSPITLDILI